MSTSENNHEKIHSVVQQYFKGVSRADRSQLEQAWNVPDGHWKGIETDKNGIDSVKVEPIADSVERWAAGSAKKSSGEVLSVDIIDDQLAVVKFDFKLGGMNYIDVLTLYKLNNEWKLINKVFVTRK